MKCDIPSFSGSSGFDRTATFPPTSCHAFQCHLQQRGQAQTEQMFQQVSGFLAALLHDIEPYCSTFYRFLGGEARRAAVLLDLVVELVCAGLDGHARAVEALWEQHPLPVQAVVRAGKLQLHNQGRAFSALELVAVTC